MRLTENALRVALREAAEDIHPDSVPGLDLARAGGGPRCGNRGPGAPQHRRWLAAVAAAVAVLAVAGAAIAIAGAPRPSRPASPLAQLPPYYVALQRQPNCQCDVNEPKGYVSVPDRALVLSRVSAKPVAIVAVPKGYGTFAAIAAAADDRTFVVAAQKLTYLGDVYPATRFYLLQINPAASPGRQAILTPLAVPPVPAGTTPIGVALSPDGQQLAVISTQTPGVHPVTLRTYDLQAGTHRTWSLPGGALVSMNIQADSPQWGADGRTLAISLLAPHGGRDIALLDTAGTRRSLLADARTVKLQGPVTLPATGTVVVMGTMTPDGQHVLEDTVNFPLLRKRGPTARPVGMRLLNIRTGAVSPILAGYSSAGLIWSNQAGTVLVVWAGRTSLTRPVPASVYAAHHVWRIWLPAATLDVAW